MGLLDDMRTRHRAAAEKAAASCEEVNRNIIALGDLLRSELAGSGLACLIKTLSKQEITSCYQAVLARGGSGHHKIMHGSLMVGYPTDSVVRARRAPREKGEFKAHPVEASVEVGGTSQFKISTPGAAPLQFEQTVVGAARIILGFFPEVVATHDPPPADVRCTKAAAALLKPDDDGAWEELLDCLAAWAARRNR